MIKVVGLGTGRLDDLSKKAVSILKEAEHIVTTASWHPVFSDLKVNLEVWDSLSLSQRIERLNRLGKDEELVLAVLGDPLLDQAYLKKVENDLEFFSASSLLSKLELPPLWEHVDLESYNSRDLKTDKVIRVHFGQWQRLQELLPKDTKITYVDCLKKGQALVGKFSIDNGYVIVPKLDVSKEGSSLEELLKTMKRLRAPDGCPWDKIQTFESLKPYLVEEAYELWDAVDSGDAYLITEELGDVLLQVVFYATIAEENGLFDLEKVASRVNEKLVHRHPHVFDDVIADTPEKVMVNWDLIKKSEKGKESRVSALDGVPKHLPGLQKAAKVQKKAAKVGFDWDEIEPVWQKVQEELEELSEAKTQEDKEEELGDLLFAIVNLARFLKIDPEVALTGTISKFQKRFRYIETHSKEPLEEMSLAEMDVFWEAAKKEDK
ncbi:MAG: nucleoside triphosphate pyrophosphohydrolase [Firmicutes bacterium]|nr:nucleoside triphosphate pyrophosphohydrolase [Bacillota bacterium]MDD4264293.1 nucleoside triphosphate pyrophosphohydrolase [Bacillota bacterium]MDD4693767.1 nucleoside triphosphate pyrophosphohydrolase [Bacillota bacterium]